MTEALASMTFEEFLEAEKDAQQRHEFVGGRIYVMAGGSERHDLLAGLIANWLWAPALTGGCRPFTGNRLVKTRSGAGYYPDFMVVCSPAPHRHHETDPDLIVEVLSPSTATIDRREKAVAYAAAETLEMLLLVHQHERRIEIARPGDGRFLHWDVAGPGGIVITRFGVLDVDELYDELDRIATTP